MNEKSPNPANSKTFLRPKWGIRTLLIWVVIAAGLVLYFQNRYRMKVMTAEIKTLYQFADELTIEDPQQIAARRKDFSDNDDISWQLYLPADYSYTLKLATENFDKTADLTTVNADATSALTPGNLELQFTLTFVQETAVVRVTDGSKTILEFAKSNRWLAGGSEDRIFITEKSRSSPTEKPLPLISRVCLPPGPQTGPNSDRGILLWIEATKLAGD